MTDRKGPLVFGDIVVRGVIRPTGKPKTKKRNTRPGAPEALSDPRQARPGEAIGGGFYVFRRTARTGRIRCPEWPFEHPHLSAAVAERDRLRQSHPDERFEVFVELPGVIPDPGPPLEGHAARLREHIAREGYTAYAACNGAALDCLVAMGHAAIHGTGPTCRVTITKAGREALKGGDA